MELFSINFFKKIIVCFLSLFTAIALSNCSGSNKDEEKGTADSVLYVHDTLALGIDSDAGKPLTIKNDLFYIIDYEKKIISKNPAATGKTLVLDSVIANLNKQYASIFLEKLKVGHDTLYTIIRDSEVLGEQMGTWGAGEYFANAVLNLTAVPGVRYVKINMEEHSHASPGIFTKKDFNDFREVSEVK